MSEDVVAELDRWLAVWSSHFGGTQSVDMEVVQRARDEIVALREALDESVKLQRHYALSLNDYDGGRRIAFESRKAWMDRLRALKDKRHD